MPKKTTPQTSPKPAAAAAPKSPKPKATTDGQREATLLLLPSSYAETPDIPVDVAAAEIAGLYKLAKKESRTLVKFGITGKQIEALGALGKELVERQRAWVTARDGGASAQSKTLRQEAELLKRRLLAAGEWALRHDDDALRELARIREGSGLPDTIEDLYHLASFWTKHAHAMHETKLGATDVKRAAALAAELREIAGEEVSNLQASRALELRNRCFWAATTAASEIRLGGRYAFSDEPKVAARFASRYRQGHRRHAAPKPNGAPVTQPKPAAPAN